jgi:hypothetical protein
VADIPQLVRSIGNVTWKAGVIDGIKHVANEDGSHTITVTVPAHVVDKASLPKPVDTSKLLRWGRRP